MTKKTTKPKFDYKRAESLAQLFCTAEEIADIMEVDAKALEKDNKFNKMYRKAFAEGKLRLREKQFSSIDEKNSTLLAWLGKVYLGQKDRSESGDKELDYDLKRLPDFYLNRMVKGEDPIKVINEFENAAAANQI